MNIDIPSIPSDWPYMPRIASKDYDHHKDVNLPGLPGLWQLETIPNLIISNKNRIRLEQSFGRGGVFKSGLIVFRPYRRGGLVRHFNTSTYYNTKRFKQEFYTHQAIWQSGLPTTEPIGWGYRRKLLGYEGVFLSRLTQGIPWPNAWQCNHDLFNQLQVMVRSLCFWKLYSPDLNATNILVDLKGNIVALDWDKAHWTNNPNIMKYYQNRLIRSMKKLNAKPEVLAKAQHYLT